MESYKSYAKINIFLDVISKLNNGYHNIRSIFTEISLADIIEVKKNELYQLRYIDKKKILPEDNLLKKAGDLFCKYIKSIPSGLDFYLDKNIPIGGGLGGGSSNAALILKLLNNYCDTNFTYNKLQKIGASIGADVPFFIKGGTQQVTGFGQKLKDIKTLPLKLNIALVIPDFSVSTKVAYDLIDEYKQCNDSKINKNKFNNLIKGLKTNDYKLIINNIYNKFELVISKEYPQLKIIQKAIMDSNADAAFMTGSGSTMIGIYDSESKLNNGSNILKNQGYNVLIAKSIF